MKSLLNELFELRTLNEAEAYQLMKGITSGTVNEAHMAALLSVFVMRDITLDELKGFRKALLEVCVPFNVDGPVVDLCGTGGDGKNTFNVSTLASFVVASVGDKVVKHGNYGVSSASGSSDVMEHFGYRFTTDHDILKKQLDENNICFLHAPLFHPALKAVAPIRKQMGIKTFFNMLGPLVNPVRPTHRFTGTYSLQLARLYHYLYQQEGTGYVIVHTVDGYDEISLTGGFKWYSAETETIIQPSDWGLPQVTGQSIYGGETVKEAADIFINILQGQGTLQQNAVVIANAAGAIKCLHPERNILDCTAAAREAIESGRALTTFKNTIA